METLVFSVYRKKTNFKMLHDICICTFLFGIIHSFNGFMYIYIYLSCAISKFIGIKYNFRVDLFRSVKCILTAIIKWAVHLNEDAI